MDCPSTFALAALGGFAILYPANRWTKPHPIPGIPHNTITSRTGDLLAVGADHAKFGSPFELGSFIPRTAQQLGPVFQMMLGPWTNVVVITDPLEYEDLMLRSRSRVMEQSPMTTMAFAGVVPYMLISRKTDDEIWKRHKKLTAPLMGSKYLAEMTPTIASNARLLVEYWTDKADIAYKAGAKCFSCKLEFAYSQLDNISAMIVERTVGAMEDAIMQLEHSVPTIDGDGGATFTVNELPLVVSLRWLFHCIEGRIFTPPWMVRIYFAFLHRTPVWKSHHGRVTRFLHSCFDERRAVIEEAKRAGVEPPPARSLIGMIFENEEQNGYKLPVRELEDETLGFIFAGQDTTALTLQWAMKFLTDAPEVQRRLHQELVLAWGAFFETRGLTYADVVSDETPYLDAVVAEVLRCARLAESVNRTNLEPIKVLGYELPANSLITFGTTTSAWSTIKGNTELLRSRDPLRTTETVRVGLAGRGLWDAHDVQQFNPSRWLEQKNGKTVFNPKAGLSYPFGIGIRSCAGRQLAQLTMKTYIATLNMAFFLDKVPSALASYKPAFDLVRIPSQAYVAPKPWAER